jgi:hypothetical protein
VPNRSDWHGHTPRALTAAADHALESTCLIDGQMAAAVFGQRPGGKRIGAIRHRLIVCQTSGGNNGRTRASRCAGALREPPAIQ